MKTSFQTAAILVMIALTIMGIIGCDNSGESNFEEAYVLQGFMPLGQRMAIRLTKTIDIDQYYDDAAVGVSGATATIWESLSGDTSVYELVEDPTQLPGTYVASNTDDTVKSGYDYSIRIEIDGHVITAVTHQAPPPFHLDTCAIVLERSGAPAETTWVQSFRDSTNPGTYSFERERYFELFYQDLAWGAGVTVFVENLEPDWYSNDDLMVSSNNGPDMTNVWAWSLRDGGSFQIPPIVLGFQGLHRIRVMSSDTAMYDYFLSAYPGSPESEPPSNVVGALGLFSVYDADTAYFCLTDPEADVVFQCQP